jgi:hypothetical protein
MLHTALSIAEVSITMPLMEVFVKHSKSGELGQLQTLVTMQLAVCLPIDSAAARAHVMMKVLSLRVIGSASFITACDLSSKPPDKKGKQQDAPCKKILGMGLHLVNA